MLIWTGGCLKSLLPLEFQRKHAQHLLHPTQLRGSAAVRLPAQVAHAGFALRDPQRDNEIFFTSVSKDTSPDLQGAAAISKAELSAREQGYV